MNIGDRERATDPCRRERRTVAEEEENNCSCKRRDQVCRSKRWLLLAQTTSATRCRVKKQHRRLSLGYLLETIAGSSRGALVPRRAGRWFYNANFLKLFDLA